MNPAAGAPARPPGALRVRLVRIFYSDFAKALIGAHLVAAIVILFYDFAWQRPAGLAMQPAGLAVYDALRVSWAGSSSNSPIVLFGANEVDLGRWGWPLRDDQLADILERLLAQKPRLIGVDLYRDRPEPPGTERLARILAAHPEIIWSFKLPEGANPAIPPPPALRGTDRAVLADTLVDADGIVRRGLLFADDGTTNYYGMAMALAQGYLAREGIQLGGSPGGGLTLGKATIHPLDESSGPYTRLDNRGYQILLDYRGGLRRFPLKPLGELMDRDDTAALVRDRIVILGIAAESVKDWFATPFNSGLTAVDERVYGIAIHGYLADQLIRVATGKTPLLHGFRRPAEYVLIWGVALIGAAVGFYFRSAIQALTAMGAGLIVIAAVTYFAFGWAIYVPSVPLIAALVGSSGLTNQLLHAATNRERTRLRRSFEHYLPTAVIAEMLASRSLPKVGGERREISVIFTDIANFTSLSEHMEPEQLAALLNEYFTGACDAVFAAGGLVYEFIGDAILAFFGAPHDQVDHADRAVAAALAIDAFAYPFCLAQRSRGLDFGITRIGVHTGNALVGNIGTPGRLKYTALGDMLNTGSRLEGLNKVIGTRVCVSGDTVRNCRQHGFRPVADFIVKGRRGAVSVFEPIDPAASGHASREEYQRAFDAVTAREANARDLFASLHRQYPDDPCVAFHHRRLMVGEDSTLIVMAEK